MVLPPLPPPLQIYICILHYIFSFFFFLVFSFFFCYPFGFLIHVLWSLSALILARSFYVTILRGAQKKLLAQFLWARIMNALQNQNEICFLLNEFISTYAQQCFFSCLFVPSSFDSLSFLFVTYFFCLLNVRVFVLVCVCVIIACNFRSQNQTGNASHKKIYDFY